MFVGCTIIWKLLKYPTTYQKMWISQKENRTKTKRQNHIHLNKTLFRLEEKKKKKQRQVHSIYLYIRNWSTYLVHYFCLWVPSIIKAESTKRKYEIYIVFAIYSGVLKGPRTLCRGSRMASACSAGGWRKFSSFKADQPPRVQTSPRYEHISLTWYLLA